MNQVRLQPKRDHVRGFLLRVLIFWGVVILGIMLSMQMQPDEEPVSKLYARFLFLGFAVLTWPYWVMHERLKISMPDALWTLVVPMPNAILAALLWPWLKGFYLRWFAKPKPPEE